MGAAQRITNGLVQEWIEHFLTKNEDYSSAPMPGFPEGFENADVLGIQGQFAELWRKIWKLRKAMWDGIELTGEPPREVLMDLIGHCFLAIDMIDRTENVVPKVAEEPVVASLGNEGAQQIAEAVRATRKTCGEVCSMGHLYRDSCRFRKIAGERVDVVE